VPSLEIASLAALLDDVRPLVVAAREGGDHPRYLMLEGASYDAVAQVKDGDRERGLPMIVLGLEIVRSDDPATRPRVF
jgi:hypothetical protein